MNLTCVKQLGALLFDLDGTLYRHAPVQRQMLISLAAAHWDRPRDAIRVFRVLRAYRAALEILRIHPPTGDLREAQLRCTVETTSETIGFVSQCVKQWMEVEPLRYLRSARYEGVVELLSEARRRGVKVAVCSDYPPAAKLRALGLEGCFDAVLWAQSPEIQRLKPDRRMIEIALEKLGVEADAAMFIGDRVEVDGAAAEAAQVRFILMNRPSLFSELLNELESVKRPVHPTLEPKLSGSYPQSS